MAWIQEGSIRGPQGPKGDKGDQGIQGPTGLKGDQGIQGVPGQNASISVTGTTTGAAGTDASVTQGGTSLNRTLSFTIPRGATGSQGVKGDTGPQGPKGDTGAPFVPDLVSNIDWPIVISHRGGPTVYPEHSMEGYLASMRDGFAPEQDIQFLSDGTMVCLHDETVDRTMTGVTGNASALTKKQFLSGKIKPAIRGGIESLPVLWEDVLNQIGGKTLLFAEVKMGATTTQVNAFIDSIKSRNLQNTIIVQSFDLPVAQQMASAGLHTLFLAGSSTTVAVSTLTSSNIDYVGVNGSMSTSYITSLKSAGIRVIGYTFNTVADYDTQMAKGLDGIFSNDPWLVSNRIRIRTGDPYHEGIGWSNLTGTSQNSAGNVYFEPYLVGNSVAMPYVPTAYSVATAKIVTCDWAGRFTGRKMRMSFHVEFGAGRVAGAPAGAPSQGNGVGFAVWENQNNRWADFQDAAVPGQNGFTFVLRRNGQMQGWKYVYGGAATSELASTPSREIAPTGKPGAADFVVTVAWDTITLECPTTGDIISSSDTYTLNDVRIGLRISNDIEARISDVRFEHLL